MFARCIIDELHGSALYHGLERAADARRLDDADRFLRSRSESLIAIDEVQRRPGLFPELWAIIVDVAVVAGTFCFSDLRRSIF